ncbi:hypothetical protein N322_13389, partial [Cariama cristata]
GSFNCDNDFPLMLVKQSPMALLMGTSSEPDLAMPALPALPALLPAQKQVLPIQFSQFMDLPAPASQFSIT